MAGLSETDWRDGGWWDEARVAALPVYLSEPRPRPPSAVGRQANHDSRQPGATWVWLATAPATMAPCPSSLIITRRIGLPPATTVAAVTRWWRDHEQRPVLTAGGDWLELGTPAACAGVGFLCRLRGHLHLKWAWPPVALEVDLAPWSASQTEVDLRAESTIRGEHRRRRFFSAGHSLADRLADEMLTIAG